MSAGSLSVRKEELLPVSRWGLSFYRVEGGALVESANVLEFGQGFSAHGDLQKAVYV